MKPIWLVAIALVLSSLWGTHAEAQVEAGDIKATIDAGIVRWMKREDTVSDGGLRQKSKLEVTGVGAFVGAGAGVGYAVSKHFIPSLFLSLTNVKSDSTTIRGWELKPSLEVALLPSLRFVPFVDAGLSLQRQLFKSEGSAGSGDSQTTLLALGPALGAGVHLFAVQHASLDLSFAYRALFNVQSSGAEELGRLKESKQHILMLNLGASLWI